MKASYLVETARMAAEHRRALTFRPKAPPLRRVKRPPPIRLYSEVAPGWTRVPRPWGRATFGPTADHTIEGEPISAQFRGVLRPHQEAALAEVLAHDEGVVRASPGTGKTVLALAAICEIGRRAAVIVHTAYLARQWVAAAAEHTTLTVGLVQGAREDFGCQLTVVMAQTAARRDAARFDMGVVFFDEARRGPLQTPPQPSIQTPSTPLHTPIHAPSRSTTARRGS